MNIEETIRLIISRCPALTRDAAQVLSSPAPQKRLNRVIRLALEDPDAGWSLFERGQLEAQIVSTAGMPHPVGVRLTTEEFNAVKAEEQATGRSASAQCREGLRIYHALKTTGVWEAFLARCTRDEREAEEILTALLQGYARRPTTEEILQAIERGPQDDSGNTAS